MFGKEGETVKLTLGKKTIGIDSDTFDVVWRAALGLALFVLIMAALSIKAHAQQTNSSQLTVKSEKTVEPKESSTATNGNQEPSQAEVTTSSTEIGAAPQATPSPSPTTKPAESKWHYGGFIDAAYILDFNHPENRVFRSRGTTWH